MNLRVGHEDVVADKLILAAEGRSEHFPRLPVVLAAAVLDRSDRILCDELSVEFDHLVA